MRGDARSPQRATLEWRHTRMAGDPDDRVLWGGGGLFPDAVAFVVAPFASAQTPLQPAEAVAVSGAAPKRKSEFRAGRAAARIALASLGHPRAVVTKGADRAPIWPRGFVGSISHSPGYCAAAVGRWADVAAIGFDVERRGAVGSDLLPSRVVLSREGVRVRIAVDHWEAPK